MSKKIKFGTDGWRAIVGGEFNLANVQAVAQAISEYLKKNAKVVVGYDTRRLSPEAARLLSRVLAANGLKVILAKQPLPTPAISHAVTTRKCTAGVVITASHNPPSFNGIKIKGSFGGPVESNVTDRVEKLIFKRQPKKISLKLARKKKIVKLTDLLPGYLKSVRAYLDMAVLKKANFKVLVDVMHGTADSYIAKILKHTDFKVTTINQQRDSSFGGIKPEPIPSCLRKAAGLMKQRRFDVGLATDGDADRIAALDSRGKFISPQQIISLLLLHLIRYRKLKGAVVTTISGTALLERIARKYSLKIYETPIGFKHISELMQKKNILIGGEEAGGIGFKNYLFERDGILAGLLLLEMMAAQNKTIDELLQQMRKEFGRFVYLRKDLKIVPEQKNRVSSKLAKMRRQKRFARTKINKIKDYDGLKFCLASGSWILFRLSGTEPVLRIYAESQTRNKTKQLIAEGVKLLNL